MTRRTSSRVWGAAVLVAVTMGGAAACGNGPAPAGGVVVKSGPVEAAAKAKQSAHAAAHVSASAGKRIFAQAYAAEMRAGSAHVSMVMGPIHAAGDVAYAGASSSTEMTMSMPQVPAPITMRLVAHTVYLQIPGATPAGKWVAVSQGDTTSPLGKAFGSTLNQVNPADSLRSSERAVTSFQLVGHERLAGVATDHYRFTLDTAKSLGALKGQLPQSTLAALPATIAYDMWLDHQHLARRLEYAVGPTVVVMKLSAWGAPVHVSAPPAGSVIRQPGA